jgi:hypothetical protein
MELGVARFLDAKEFVISVFTFKNTKLMPYVILKKPLRALPIQSFLQLVRDHRHAAGTSYSTSVLRANQERRILFLGIFNI